MSKRCVIVGAGHGAAQLVASLGSEGYNGEVYLIGEEPGLPYHRPPLSKAYLSGELPADKMLIRAENFYQSRDIHLKTGQRVGGIDTQSKKLALENGESIAYDKLVLATGTRPRRLDKLSGGELAGICYLRTRQDTDRIIKGLETANNIAIVGGGYIGLETAASLRKLGKKVTVIELADRILERVTAPVISEFYASVHREMGVNLLEGTEVSGFIGQDGKVTGVKTSGGKQLDTDLVIVGVGVQVNDELAVEAGLEVDNGIVVDEYCQTSNTDILAIGDCTNHYNGLYERRLRLESVPNAIEQAKIAAKTLAGKPTPYNSLPWFWSDQYDLKLQIAGLSQGYDETVIKGYMESRSFCVYYLKNGRTIAADAVNSPRDFMLAKKLILQGEGV